MSGPKLDSSDFQLLCNLLSLQILFCFFIFIFLISALSLKIFDPKKLDLCQDYSM